MSQNVTQSPQSRQAAIDRAVAKAYEQARAGNLPTLLRTYHDGWETQQVWSVGSRVTAGAVYMVDLTASASGIETLCSCAASDNQRVCWHRGAVRLAALGDLAYYDRTTLVEADTSEPGPHSRVTCSQVVTANGALQVPNLVKRCTAEQLGLAATHPYFAYTVGAGAMAAD